jgi:hypothetical protein
VNMLARSGGPHVFGGESRRGRTNWNSLAMHHGGKRRDERAKQSGRWMRRCLDELAEILKKLSEQRN